MSKPVSRIPPAVYAVIYDECGGFVDCEANPQVIWEACRTAALAEAPPVDKEITRLEAVVDAQATELRNVKRAYTEMEQASVAVGERLTGAMDALKRAILDAARNTAGYHGFGKALDHLLTGYVNKALNGE